VYVLYELLSFVDNVVRATFLCKHVRLSRVFYNKLTYLLTRPDPTRQNQEGLHFYVGSTFHWPTSEIRRRLWRGQTYVMQQSVLINTIPILITSVQKQFLFID